MHRRPIITLTLPFLIGSSFVVSVVACVGDEPETTNSSTTDGGGSTGDGEGGGIDEGGRDDTSSATDGGSDARDDVDGGLSVSKSGLLLWLAADQSVDTSPTTVFRWSDLSGSGHHATQIDQAHAPTLTKTFFPNGMPAVVFGANQVLKLPDSPEFNNFANGASMFVVVRPSLATSADFLHFGGVGKERLAIQENASQNWSLVVGSTVVSANKPSTVAETHILEVIAEPPADGGLNHPVNLFRDGEPCGTSLVIAFGNQVRNGNVLGAATLQSGTGVVTGAAQGAYAEVLVFSRTVTPGEQLTIEQYLKARWGL